MTVYIEYVFLSNFIFNFLLLYATVRILKIRYKKRRLFAADLFGTAVAIAVPLLNLSVIFSVAVKLSLSVGIVLLLARYKSKKQFLAALMLFWGLTFALGGIMMGIYFLLGEDFALQNDLGVVSSSPLPLFAGGFLCFVFLIKNLVAYINVKRAGASFVYSVVLVVDGERIETSGFLDSGNRLVDGKSGLPVIIAVSKPLIQKLKQSVAESIISKKGWADAHYTEFSTLAGGSRKMFVFSAQSVIVNGKEVSAVIGLADEAKMQGECDILLNSVLSL